MKKHINFLLLLSVLLLAACSKEEEITEENIIIENELTTENLSNSVLATGDYGEFTAVKSQEGKIEGYNDDIGISLENTYLGKLNTSENIDYEFNLDEEEIVVTSLITFKNIGLDKEIIFKTDSITLTPLYEAQDGSVKEGREVKNIFTDGEIKVNKGSEVTMEISFILEEDMENLEKINNLEFKVENPENPDGDYFVNINLGN